MPKKKLRVGVIGVGSIGTYHLDIYRSTPTSDPVALSDIDRTRANDAGKKFGVANVFTDYEKMLEMSDLDAVSICLPNSLHAPASIAALEAGKHVLCEKPLTVDVESAERMVEASRKTGRRLAMSLNFRHSGNAQRLKRAADAGKLGRIYHGKGGMLRDDAIPRGWFHRKEYSGGGPLLDLASHILDVTWWIMGKPKPIAASGTTYAEFGPRGLGMGTWGVGWAEGPFDVEDFALGLIRFDEGQTLFVEVSWAINAKPKTYSYVCGTEGGATLHPEFEIFKTDGTPIRTNSIPDEEPPARFVKDLLAGRPAVGSVEDGLMVMKMFEGIYRSADAKKEVEIE